MSSDKLWYNALVEECKAIITEAVFTSRFALVEGYWNLGKRIREEEKLKKWDRDDTEILQGLAKDIDISERTIYYAIQAYEKYPDLSLIPEGKNISWNKMVTKYLPAHKEENECLHEKTIQICQRCRKVISDGVDK